MPAHTQVSGSHLQNHTKTSVTIITPHAHAQAGSYCNGDSAELEFARGGLILELGGRGRGQGKPIQGWEVAIARYNSI